MYGAVSFIVGSDVGLFEIAGGGLFEVRPEHCPTSELSPIGSIEGTILFHSGLHAIFQLT